MLPVAEETLRQIAQARGKQVATHLYGQEINAETYAISKADFLLHDLRWRGRQQQLRADFVVYLDFFSPDVQEIVDTLDSATRSRGCPMLTSWSTCSRSCCRRASL